MAYQKSIYIDPKAGDYVNRNGQLAHEISVINKANLLLKQRPYKWIYSNIGNSLLDNTDIKPVNEIRDALHQCLSVLITNGDAQSIEVKRISKNTVTQKYTAVIYIYLSASKYVELEWNQNG